MSWANGNKKWTIPFMSLNGTSCRIDIYQRGYTGSTVTELSTNNDNAPGVAAADPFYYEEDDDEDLLSVVRYKTGYINLVETTYGGLSELYPTKNNTHYVEFYIGQTLNFVGFIQAQNFENPWQAAPREISLPIISPLGLLGSIDMPVYNPPQALSLAAHLDDVMGLLIAEGAQYGGVTWPQLSVGLDATLSTLVTSPFNDDYIQTFYLFKPISCLDFIEGLCNCFGWIIHETATEIVFSMFDHTSDYNWVSIANLRTLTSVTTIPTAGSTTQPLTDYVTPADSDGKESAVMPVNKVVLEYEGEYIKSSQFNFMHLLYNGATIDGNQAALWLSMPDSGENRTPEISGGDVQLLPSNFFYNGKLTNEGTNPSSFGTIGTQTEGFLVNLPNSTNAGWLFTVKYYDRPTGNQLKIIWNMRWGDTLLTLTDDESVNHKMVGIKVKIGDLWYHGNGTWNTTEPGEYHYGSGEYYWDLTDVPDGGPIEVRFYEVTQEVVDHRVQTLTIENLKIEELPTMWSDYIYKKAETDTIANGSGNGEGEASVNMLFSLYRKNSNMVGTQLLNSRFTDYPYMMKTNARWQIKFKKNSSLPSWVYVAYMTFMSQSWRVISISEYPWDNEVVVTLQRVIN